MVQRYEQMRRLQWYKCGAAYVESKTKRIVSRQFYNVSGVKLTRSQHGLNIVKTRYEDGTEKTYSFVKQ